MLKKIAIYIIIIAIIFCGGFLAGGINPGKRATELANDIDSIKSQLAKQTERNRILTAGLRQASYSIADLTGEIAELTESNRYLIDKLGSIGGGITEDISGLQTVIEGLQGYIEKAKTAETIDSN